MKWKAATNKLTGKKKSSSHRDAADANQQSGMNEVLKEITNEEKKEKKEKKKKKNKNKKKKKKKKRKKKKKFIRNSQFVCMRYALWILVCTDSCNDI